MPVGELSLPWTTSQPGDGDQGRHTHQQLRDQGYVDHHQSLRFAVSPNRNRRGTVPYELEWAETDRDGLGFWHQRLLAHVDWKRSVGRSLKRDSHAQTPRSRGHSFHITEVRQSGVRAMAL